MAVHRDDVDQARVNVLKTVRTAIRLRHSINADNELNEVLPKVEARFNAQVMRGILPDPIDIKKAFKL